MKNQLKTACGVLALALAGQVSAATTWTVGSTASVVAGSGGSAVTSTSTGWADTGAVTGATRFLEQQTMSTYTNSLGEVGLAITNKDACGSSPCDTGEGAQPEHAIDNNQRYEMVLLSFSSAVKLAQMKMSWAQGGDSDVTVMAYTAGGAPATLAGKKWTAASLTGWSVIGNYANVGDTSPMSINAGGTFSSYWLIGAYNPLGGSVATGFTDQDDYVKLASVTGCVQGTTGCNPPTGKVPEPGSLALLGIGLLGLIRMRKAKQA